MSIRIGANPIGWSNDDLQTLGGETPLETCLAEASQIGFQGMELGHKFPRDPAALRPILDRYGLSLVSGWYSSELLRRTVEDEIEVVQAHLSLLGSMGCKVMVWCETSGCVHGQKDVPLSRRPRMDAGRWSELGQRLTAVADYLLSQGMQMAYHHHMGTVVETVEEIDLLMQHTGESVGLLLDTGHVTFAGGDPVAVARKWGHRVEHVHCKDVRPAMLEQSRAGDWSFLDSVIAGVYTVPGDGCVDFPAVLREIKLAGYAGEWLVIEAEQDPARAHPATYAAKGYRYLGKLVRELGL
jgi:inosose dehydratase